MCYNPAMAREITQRELRNESGEIMRALDRGETFVVTRNGVPVGELIEHRSGVPVLSGGPLAHRQSLGVFEPAIGVVHLDPVDHFDNVFDPRLRRAAHDAGCYTA